MKRYWTATLFHFLGTAVLILTGFVRQEYGPERFLPFLAAVLFLPGALIGRYVSSPRRRHPVLGIVGIIVGGLTFFLAVLVMDWDTQYSSNPPLPPVRLIWFGFSSLVFAWGAAVLTFGSKTET